MKKISQFIDNLASIETNDTVFNQYSSDDNFLYASVTKSNLLCYLTAMADIKPKTILVGEAPGYKGCRLTGIPFTSESIMASGNFDLFNYDEQSQAAMADLNWKPQKESTATIIWSTFKELDFYPLLWNACPFHPFAKGISKSNRKPTNDEINLYGKKAFADLCSLFSIEYFVAVGNSAEYALNNFGIKQHEKLPHPSYGNKNTFVTGLTKLVADGIIK